MPSIFVAKVYLRPAIGEWIEIDDLTATDGQLYMDDDHICERPIAGHITDYESGLSTWQHVVWVVEGRDDHDLDVDVMIAWLAYHDDFDHDRCADAHCGQWESDEDFAESLFDDCVECPNHLRGYIDMTRYARDTMCDHFESSGHYFRSF